MSCCASAVPGCAAIVVLWLTALSLSGSLAIAADSPDDRQVVAGRSLGEWREVLKNLDPQDPWSRTHVPGMIRLMQQPEVPWFTRRQAALTMGRMQELAAEAVPVLTANFAAGKDEDEQTVLWSIKALSLFGPVARDAAPALIAILQDEVRSAAQRQSALYALSQIGTAHPRVVPVLIGVLQSHRGRSSGAGQVDRDAVMLQELAAESLALIGPPAAVAIPALLRAAEDPQDGIRRKATTALGAMGADAEIAVPALMRVMVLDESEAVRDAAAASLAAVGRAAVPGLSHLLEDRETDIRLRAARALGQIGAMAKPAIPQLKGCTADESGFVRLAAWEAIRLIEGRGEETAAGLAELLTSRERQVRIGAARLLIELGPDASPAVPRLKGLQSHPRYDVRLAVEKVLEGLGAAVPE